MSHPRPSPTIPCTLKIVSFGLAGVLAGLLSGCSSNTAAQLMHPRNDTDWQTTSTYASATASLSFGNPSLSNPSLGNSGRRSPHLHTSTLQRSHRHTL